MFAFGLYNGQGGSRAEANDGLHKVARFTYPWTLKSGQIVEASLQAYTGRFLPTTDGRVPGLPVGVYGTSGGFKDERVGITGVWYPQPFGVQAEWNWGTGPQLNGSRTAIETASLQGGYVQMMYRVPELKGTGLWIPFVKWQLFDGSLKSQPNAPATTTNDWEFGVEWQPNPSIELTAVYQSYNRNDVTRFPYGQFSADVFRVQLQINY
jgi:phosphate-selective porin